MHRHSAWESKDPAIRCCPGPPPLDHGHLYAGRLAGSLRSRSRLCGVRSVVRSVADRDHAEPRVCERRHVPRPHDDATHSFTSPSIFGLLHEAQSRLVDLRILAGLPRPASTSPIRPTPPSSHFGVFTDFTAAAAAGTLPPYTFLEPCWESTGNSQHPNYDVALGEQLIHDVYYALRKSPAWNQTLLILTYDEHGGCYDHVAPPGGATPPDDRSASLASISSASACVCPTVLVSPLIAAGTVFRVARRDTARSHLDPEDRGDTLGTSGAHRARCGGRTWARS